MLKQVTPFVVTYHPDLPPLNRILLRHQCLIELTPRLKGALPEPPLVVYRRPSNLKNLLVRAAIRGPQHPHEGTSRCGQPRCKTCVHIKSGNRFRSATTGEEFRVKATADCRTSNVVYLIECSRCSIQYVGETENALRIRLTGHRSDIHHRRLDRPVAKHFNLLDHSLDDLTIMIIEKIHRVDALFRKRRESHWIQAVRSLTPDGLNLEV